MLSKLAYINPAAKSSAVNLPNSWVVRYLAWSGSFFSASPILALRTVVVTKLVVSGISFSTSLIYLSKTVLVTKPLVFGNVHQHLYFFSKFCLSMLYWFRWTKVVASGIFFSKLSTFVFSVLNFFFLTTLLSTTSLNFLRVQQQFF